MNLETSEKINLITTEYNNIANSGFDIRSSAVDYRQIFPPRWPTRKPTVHYEFIFESEENRIYIEIHLEYSKLQDTPEFQEVMTNIIEVCRRDFPNSNERLRKGKDGALGRGIGFYFGQPFNSKEIAEALKNFIDVTYEGVTNVLDEAELLKQE